MTKFSIKRLFASVAIIAVGCAMLFGITQIRTRQPVDVVGSLRDRTLSIQLLLAFFGPCTICGGIGNIFKRAPIGCAIGLAVAFAVNCFFGYP